MSNIGTILKRKLSYLGFSPSSNCSCNKLAKEMDEKGPNWCTKNIEYLLEKIKENAKRKKTPFIKWIVKKLILSATHESLIMDLKSIFEKIYVINIPARKMRLEQFNNSLPKDWPFKTPEVFNAIHGRLCNPPEWWKAGRGAWGCYRSHYTIIEQCLNQGIKSVLLLEDDALCEQDFLSQVTEFFQNVPNNWEMVYLGGQHLKVNAQPPEKVNDLVFKPYNVNRTHAYGLQGQGLLKVYKHLSSKDWISAHHIDHHLGRLHQSKKIKVYCPNKWLIGQNENRSDISGKEFDEPRFWPAAETLDPIEIKKETFILVTGIHSSGTSCLTGILYHLGIHLGNKFIGYYGNNPEKECGFEAVELSRICDLAIKFPSCSLRMPKEKIYSQLKSWITEKKKEASNQGKLAGGKHPLLCALSNQIMNITGQSLKVINIERDIEESIKSLQVREPRHNPEMIETHQRWLYKNKLELLSKLPLENIHTLTFDNLIKDTPTEVKKIISFLNINPTTEQIEKAITSIQKDKKHQNFGDTNV